MGGKVSRTPTRKVRGNEVFDMTMEFNVRRAFEATAAISGRQRRFERGSVVTYDTGQSGPTVTIEAALSLFLVDRSTFETCCKPKNQGTAGF
jgi:hypothetical protein